MRVSKDSSRRLTDPSGRGKAEVKKRNKRKLALFDRGLCCKLTGPAEQLILIFCVWNLSLVSEKS